MSSQPRMVEFAATAPGEVLAVMGRLGSAGSGWINFEPEVDPELVPAASGMFSIFSARGPVVPLGTWTPPSTTRRGRADPAMIGLQHPAGTRAKKLLADAGHPVPAGWTVTQDHSRKGVVLAVPPSADDADVLSWLLTAAELLTVVPLMGGWRAVVYGDEKSGAQERG